MAEGGHFNPYEAQKAKWAADAEAKAKLAREQTEYHEYQRRKAQVIADMFANIRMNPDDFLRSSQQANPFFTGRASEPYRGPRPTPQIIPDPAWCKVLGLPRTATREQIKTAYRKLAIKHHPDTGGSQAEFAKLNDAYQTALAGV